MKKRLLLYFSMTLACLCMGFLSTPVHACACGTTYFFNGAEDGSWNNPNNWWLDSDFTLPAGGIPSVDTDSAEIYASVTSIIGSTPIVSQLNVHSTANFFITINVTGNATFHDTSALPGRVYGTADFYNSSQSAFFANIGSHIGDYTFHDTSSNAGVLNGSGTFKDSSHNNGLVTENADVYYPSANPIGGSVSGTVTYHDYGRTMYFNAAIDHDWSNLNNWWDDANFTVQSDSLPNPTDTTIVSADVNTDIGGHASVNIFIGTSTAVIYPDVTVATSASFYTTSCITGTFTGNVTLHDSSCNGGVVIGNLHLNDTSLMGGQVTGNAYYNTTAYNTTAPTDGIFTVNGSHVLVARITGTVYGADNTPITRYVFKDSSIDDSYLPGTYEFHDTSTDDMAPINGDAYFYDTSTNGIEIDGNSFFHDSSTNSGYTPLTFTASFFDSSTNTSFAYIDGTTEVYYPSPRPIAGTINGAIHYHNYPEDAPPTPPSHPRIAPQSSAGFSSGSTPVIQPKVIPIQTPAIVAPKSTPFFLNFSLGATNKDVITLQKYLNSHGFLIVKSGDGSPGKEIATFGPATKKALIAFQKAHTIIPASGYFGPLTRAFVNSH